MRPDWIDFQRSQIFLLAIAILLLAQFGALPRRDRGAAEEMLPPPGSAFENVFSTPRGGRGARISWKAIVANLSAVPTQLDRLLGAVMALIAQGLQPVRKAFQSPRCGVT